MNIPTDTINSAMTLAGGLLALLAAIVAAVATMLPKEKAIAVIAQLREKTFSFLISDEAQLGPPRLLIGSPIAGFCPGTSARVVGPTAGLIIVFGLC